MKEARRNRANWLNTLTASLRRETLRQELSTGVVKSLTTAEAPTDRVPQALATARDLLAFSTRESFIYFQQLHLLLNQAPLWAADHPRTWFHSYYACGSQ
jgi:hypothetical protein